MELLHPSCCSPCADDALFLCRCVRVTEAQLEQAVAGREVRTIRDLGQLTGAGTGCMCCHPRLRAFLAKRQAAAVAAYPSSPSSSDSMCCAR